MGDLTVFEVDEKLRNVGENVTTIYCMGRDNVPFYTILYPSLLRFLGKEFLTPDIVVANYDICFNGLPCSKSQNRTIDLETAIQLLPSDYWRAYLVSIFPIKLNADFDPIAFEYFVKVNLKELDEYLHNIHRLCLKFNPSNHNELTRCNGILEVRLVALLREFQASIETYDFSSAMSLIFRTAKDFNIVLRAILTGEKNEVNYNDFLREVFVLNPLISIFMPETSRRLCEMFGFSKGKAVD